MAKYEKKTINLSDQHTWTATPGYNVIALDRGAVRLDFPREWIVIPDNDSLKIHDRQPPDDDCVLAVSYIRLAPIDWSGLPLATLVEAGTEEDERPIHTRGDIISSRHGDIEFAWREMAFIDPVEQREAFARLCIARKGVVQALITFDFWESDADRYRPVWDAVLKSVRLNDYIADPAKGPWGRDA